MLLAASFLAACNNNQDPSITSSSQGGGSGGEGTSGSEAIPEGYVRVYFYVDFNQIGTGEYHTYQDVLPNSKVTKPTDPAAPSQDFPTFLGWSYKELIRSPEDLWNFDTDKVDPEEGTSEFSIIGIWDI